MWACDKTGLNGRNARLWRGFLVVILAMAVAVGGLAAVGAGPAAAAPTAPELTAAMAVTEAPAAAPTAAERSAAVPAAVAPTAKVSATGLPDNGWTSHAIGNDASWQAVAYGGPAGAELFVALDWGIGITATSPDGLNWTLHEAVSDDWTEWSSVTWGGRPGAERFVAVSSTGTSMYSEDGLTWHLQPSAFTDSWSSVTWGGPPGEELFVAVGNYGSYPDPRLTKIMTSVDGTNWQRSGIAGVSDAWQSVTYGGPSDEKVFVAVSHGSSTEVITSVDGLAWEEQDSGERHSWRSITYGGAAGNERFVAVGGSGVMTSSNGFDWDSQTPSSTNEWLSVTSGTPAGQGLFVAVGGSQSMYSFDGTTWAAHPTGLNQGIKSVTYGGPEGSEQFVAVAQDGPGNRVITSPMVFEEPLPGFSASSVEFW